MLKIREEQLAPLEEYTAEAFAKRLLPELTEAWPSASEQASEAELIKAVRNLVLRARRCFGFRSDLQMRGLLHWAFEQGLDALDQPAHSSDLANLETADLTPFEKLLSIGARLPAREG